MDAPTASADLAPLNGAVILFDLDGTLVDSAPDLTAALNHALRTEGLPPCPPEAVRHLVGRGARVLIRRALARLGTAYPDPGVEAMLRDFLAYYADHIADHTTPAPGLRASLDTLRAAGATLCVATNKPDRLAVALLDALDLSGYFERVVGATRAPRPKPSASHLAAAAGADGLDRAIMVGDSETDFHAARNAGVPIILIRDGYSERDIDALGADAVIDAFAHLPRIAAQALAA